MNTQTMTGVVLPGNRRLELREFEVPEPGHGQVLVRMKASSLCGSDLRAIYRPTDQGHGPEAYRGVIAGHEPCGQVERVGTGVNRIKPGDRVVVYHIAGCGQCAECQKGYFISCSSPNRAAYGWQRNGGHAPFLLAEERTLLVMPDSLTYADGAIVACGFGTAYAALQRAGVSGADRVLVTGLGPVGLGVAILARAFGAQVVGVEGALERVAIAADHGFRVVMPGDHAQAELLEQSGGHGFEVAIDASGHPAARHQCLELARDWGRVVFIGEGGTVTFAPSPLLIHKQLSLMGSWVCSVGQMAELLERLARWELHPEVTITHRFGLEQAHEAYEVFDTGRTGKVAIVWD